MPQDYEDVWACGEKNGNNVQSGAFFTFGKWWERGGNLWTEVYDRPVTHWKPLPAPPETGGPQ